MMYDGEIRLGENVSIVQCSDSCLDHFCRLLRLQNVSLLITSSHFFFFPPLQLHSSLLDPTFPLPQAPLSLFLLPLGLTAKIKCWKFTTNSGNLMSSLRLVSASQQSVSAWKVLRKENSHTPLGFPFSVPHKSTESPYGKSSLEGEIMHSRPSMTSNDSHLKFRAKA